MDLHVRLVGLCPFKSHLIPKKNFYRSVWHLAESSQDTRWSRAPGGWRPCSQHLPALQSKGCQLSPVLSEAFYQMDIVWTSLILFRKLEFDGWSNHHGWHLRWYSPLVRLLSKYPFSHGIDSNFIEWLWVKTGSTARYHKNSEPSMDTSLEPWLGLAKSMVKLLKFHVFLCYNVRPPFDS